MVKFIRKYRLEMIGTILGLTAGFLYWKFAGCESGSCAITSKPLNSAVYGGLMGFFTFSIFKKQKT